ncbi:MAG: PD-(D/E)XK nuclease domain-containing protein [Selenomonadaceae bacterium]|nr:PD-(D/E)XK nuclease domain-containing protein [Selenomonadaceae bacterium]
MSCVLTMAYTTAPAYYNIERELPAGKGFADLAFIPRKDTVDMPAILIELKYDKTADTAIKQIKEKRYAGKLTGYADKIMLVGINYDKTTKKHECVIEEWYFG